MCRSGDKTGPSTLSCARHPRLARSRWAVYIVCYLIPTGISVAAVSFPVSEKRNSCESERLIFPFSENVYLLHNLCKK